LVGTINMYKQKAQLEDMSKLLEPIGQQLNSIEYRLRETFRDQHDVLTTATEHLLDSGGKRVRPIVALLSASIFESNQQHAVSLAAAVEMLHTATLVHDDLIDGSLMRRGIKTLNADFSSEVTILTGDYLFARAASFAAQTQSVRVMNLFAETLMTIVNGEIKQSFANQNTTNRQNYFQRIQAKTASMFALAAEAGAILGTQDEKAIDAMRHYGINTGIAFQIVDDILDFVGDSEDIGKPVGNDLQQGLLTLPTLYYIEDNPDNSDVASLQNGHNKDQDLYKRVVQSISSSSAIDSSFAEASRYVESAKSALEQLPQSKYLEALHTIANYVVERKF